MTTVNEWPDRLTADEIGALIRTGARPERPAGWSPDPDADAALDAEADAVLMALSRTAATERDEHDGATSSEPEAPAVEARPRRGVPLWVLALVALPAVAAAAAGIVLGLGWAAEAADARTQLADIESQIEELQ